VLRQRWGSRDGVAETPQGFEVMLTVTGQAKSSRDGLLRVGQRRWLGLGLDVLYAPCEYYELIAENTLETTKKERTYI
jgi:hypothetical protein